MATTVHIPKGIIRSKTFHNGSDISLYTSIEMRPHLQLRLPPREHEQVQEQEQPPIKLNKNDTLYFKLQSLLTRKGINPMYILELIYTILDTKTLVSKEVKSHFYPLNTLSVKWWNYTNVYIYTFRDVANAVKYVTELEAFPLNKRDLYDIV